MLQVERDRTLVAMQVLEIGTVTGLVDAALAGRLKSAGPPRVARLTLRHGPMPRRAPPPPRPAEVPLPIVEGGPSADLNAALARLGAAMQRPRG